VGPAEVYAESASEFGARAQLTVDADSGERYSLLMRGINQLVLVGLVLVTACGGSAPPPEEPETTAAVDSPDDVEQTAAGEKASSSDGAPSAAEHGDDQPAAAPAPEFKPGMSVTEAINAVPPGVERANIEQEALSRPLMEATVYEPCKLGAAHFKLKVAVWDGKAVGIDVSTTPKSDKLAECIRSQVGQLEWPDKVKSLNTVEYQL